MSEAALASGVPSARILVEDTSTNTTENVLNSFHLIDNSLGIQTVSSILLVAIHFHMRRAKLTVERHFPGSVRIGSASYPSAHYTRENWHQTERGRRDVLAEVAKIEKYLGHKTPGKAELAKITAFRGVRGGPSGLPLPEDRSEARLGGHAD